MNSHGPVVPQRTVLWTPEMLEQFDQQIEKAEKQPGDMFKFDGLDFYIPYARYLSQYLHDKFKKVTVNQTK